jgi:hypothetical protein
VRETRHYLGLELAGAKNQKTALAALEYYPREKKIFLLDIFDRIAPHEGAHPYGSGTFGVTSTGDAALLALIDELTESNTTAVGVNVPLQLPPCLMPAGAAAPAVKWMREITRKTRDALEFTPYTQRPVELWMRYQVLPELPESHRFEIDETLGGTKAPLTARMNFLQRHLGDLPLMEVWPKLSVAVLALELNLPRRVVQTYRRLEEGIQARETILEVLSEKHGIFVYERDVRKLSHSLPAFDAFFCAYTALLADNSRCAKPPKGFPKASGWVQYPEC